MLDINIQNQLKEHFTKIEKDVTLRLFPVQSEKSEELIEMLEDIAALSERITFVRPESIEKSPIHTGEQRFGFDVLSEANETGIVFSGIPGGHEFTSLVLAILQAGGVPLRIDQTIRNMIESVSEPLKFQTFVSLDCHNCPDVVQTLNGFALLNPFISHEMIDGALFPDLIEENKIQGVPTVFLNGNLFVNGKVDAGQIIERMLEQGMLSNSQGTRSDESEVAAEQKLYDMAIIGGGPGGVSAAVYAARKGLKVTVIADKIGGQVKDTMDIENAIALPKTTGPNLTGTLTEQLRNHSIDVREHLKVTEINPGEEKSPKTITLNTGESIQSKTIIIATGAKWKELNVPGEKENLGNGVAYCPHCDGPFFKGKTVAVIGGGNSGVEAALDLSGIVKHVYILEFAPEFNADKVLIDRMKATDNITLIASAQTESIESENGKVSALLYKDRQNDESRKIELDGVFVQIGLLPNSTFVNDLLETNRFGEIIRDEKCRTNIPGIFACGDVTTVPYKQIVIALGDGATASLAAFEYLMTLPIESSEPKEAVGV